MESTASIVVETKKNESPLSPLAITAETPQPISEKPSDATLSDRLAQIPPVRRRATPTSRPIMRQACTLRSQPAQFVFDKSFYKISDSLYIVAVILRVIANDEAANQVGQEVDAKMTQIIEEMKAEIGRLDKLKIDNGLETIKLDFTKPTTFEVEIGSPKAARYLNMITLIDKIAESLDILWFGSVMDEVTHKKVTEQWINTLLKMCRNIIQKERRARNAARRLKHAKGNNAKVKAITTQLGAEAITDKKPEPMTAETPAVVTPAVTEAVTNQSETVTEQIVEEKTKRKRKAK